jgi:hypothetical protein
MALFGACGRTSNVSGPLPQRGYLWQRDWTPAVIDALAEAQERMDGVVVLGAEIIWTGNAPQVVRASIDWRALKARDRPCGIALRVAPYPGPFAGDDASTRLLVDVTKSLLDEARSNGVAVAEFQFDFDCAQKNLGNYRAWIRTLRPAIHPIRFVITTLPAWLNEPEFVSLVREADGYVLQVHSVPAASGGAGGAKLCDPAAARQWVAKAAKLRLPFSVALPTYRCTAGYNAAGTLLGVVMDSVQLAWPPDTRILEFATNADEMAALVNEWQNARPPELRELIWYRVPVATDIRNWRWVTLSAVMSGRPPIHKLNVVQEGENPIDVSIVNGGEADEKLGAIVTGTWKANTLVAADALPGWIVDLARDRAVFTRAGESRLQLAPGARRKIGWLRYDRPTSLQLTLAKQDEASR